MKLVEDRLGQEVSPVWFIRGDATPLIDEAVRLLVERTLPLCGLPQFNHSEHRVDDGAGMAAVSTARTLPMMADMRLVVVRDAHLGPADFYEALLDYLENPSPSTVLVLAAGPFPKVRKGGKDWGRRVLNAVTKAGTVVAFDASKINPASYARDHAASLGKELSPSDASLLIDIVGSDLAQVAREVEKVALFAGDDPITADAITESCSLLSEQVIWDLTDGIAQRSPDLALKALHRMMEADSGGGRRLLAVMTSQLRTMLQLSELVNQRVPDHDWPRDLKRRWRLAKTIRSRPDMVPPPHVVLGELADANLKMNSHRAGDRRVLEDLVMRLATS